MGRAPTPRKIAVRAGQSGGESARRHERNRYKQSNHRELASGVSNYAILPSAMSVNTIVKMATVSTMPSAAR